MRVLEESFDVFCTRSCLSGGSTGASSNWLARRMSASEMSNSRTLPTGEGLQKMETTVASSRENREYLENSAA